MNSYLFLPLAFLKFWYIETPRDLWGFIISLNKAFFKLFSLPLLLKTYLKPLKNEYRQGLIRFSIILGVIIKSVLILADVILLLLLLLLEVTVFVAFLAFPIMTVMLLIW